MLVIFRIFLLNLVLDINNGYSDPVFDTIPGQKNDSNNDKNDSIYFNNNKGYARDENSSINSSNIKPEDISNNKSENLDKESNTNTSTSNNSTNSIDINATISQMQKKISELESKLPNDLKNKEITSADNPESIKNEPKIIDNNFKLIDEICEKLNKNLSDSILNNVINTDLFDLIKSIILSCSSYENTKKIIENSLESLETLTESYQKNKDTFQKLILYRYAISTVLVNPNNILSSVINFKHTDFIQQQKIIEILERFLGNISVFISENYIQTIKDLLSIIIKKTQEKQLIPSELIFVIANVIRNSISEEIKIFESTSRETLRSLESITNEIKSLLKELEHTLTSKSTAPILKPLIESNIKLISSISEIISKINRSLIENNEKLTRNTKEIIETLNFFEKYNLDPKIQDEIQKLNTNNKKLIEN